MKNEVVICEMSPRDGIQVLNRNERIPIEMRLALIKSLQKAGFPYIEVGSLVSPKVVPSMRDIMELQKRIPRYDGQLAILVPNKKYFEKFENNSNVNTVALFVAASEWYSKRNTRMTVPEAMDSAREVALSAKNAGYRLRAHLSASFRELGEENKPTSQTDILKICETFIALGCEVVALADTDGKATVDDMKRILTYLLEKIGLKRIGVHLHDRDGKGLQKARVAYEIGVRVFDASVGGIGGNLFLKGSGGNIASEELFNMFENSGIKTGLDIDALLDAGKIIFEMSKIVGDQPPPSKFLKKALLIKQSS